MQFNEILYNVWYVKPDASRPSNILSMNHLNTNLILQMSLFITLKYLELEFKVLHNKQTKNKVLKVIYSTELANK